MTRPLLDLSHRPTELGRIRLGAKAISAKGKEYPTKLETWRLTSASLSYLTAAAGLYGGSVEAWDDAPDEGYYQLLTESRELRVLIPANLETLTQSFELWQGGVCSRRCDGTTEQISGGPCLCDPADRECMPRTRLNIMLPDVPGLGVWRLETSGYHAATSLPATIELLKGLSTQPWIPAVLRLEQRSKKSRDDKGKVVTHRFAVPVLDLPGITVGKVVARMGNAEAPRIEATAPPAQPSARERIAQQRAAIEASTNGTGPISDGAVGQEAEPPHPADAGVRADIPPSGPGSTDTGRTAIAGTEPAIEEVADRPPAATSSPPSVEAVRKTEQAASTVQRCEGFHDELGACQRTAGHEGNHQTKDLQSWR